MALTPFDMEGVNRDLLAAGNPAKPDMQSILRRNARDLVLGNAILVSSVDAKELEFGVHMAYSDADDGGGCFYTDAQPIDYTQGMDYSPQQLAADSGLGDTVPLACESNASYSLAHHPDIKFTATGSPDGRKALEVSAPGSARHALITAKPGTFDVSLHDERGIVSGESFPYEANDSWTYRLSGQALRGALDLAVGWADPQETSPETAGLDLALDDGMETTHGH